VLPCQTPEPRPFRSIALMILRVSSSRAPFFKCTQSQSRFSRIPHLRPVIRTPLTMSACVASKTTPHIGFTPLPHLTHSLLSMFSPSLAATPGLSRAPASSQNGTLTEPSQYRRSTLLKRPKGLRRIPQSTGTSGQKIRCVINTCRTR